MGIVHFASVCARDAEVEETFDRRKTKKVESKKRKKEVGEEMFRNYQCTDHEVTAREWLVSMQNQSTGNGGKIMWPR